MMALLSVERVSRRFERAPDLAERIVALAGGPDGREVVHAVDDVSLEVVKGEVLGLVGESGCGKSTLGRMLCGLLPPSAGTIRYRGKDVSRLAGHERTEAALAVQMVFQDPMASLNPRMRVGDSIAEAPVLHRIVPSRQARDYAVAEMERVGLHADFVTRYPHQLSGGQRARVGIARALAVKPKILVCDEAVAALDVSIQAQIINLFIDLRHSLDLTFVFVSHDLGVIEHIADRVAVMYLGRIVEMADAATLFSAPNHPYTKALLAEVPRLDARHRRFSALRGEIPSPLHPPSGCHFHPRCSSVMPSCRSGRPELLVTGADHVSACRLNEIALASPSLQPAT